ncbi:unnamed protein product [Strongylus vulgaris]|uniref:Peptidase A1 domain-containing protein n=1 Tax=Strongylus vulgaris TaxID=40348 RepID=A0A3P7IZ80_STRVU|nr:unnamed protein product [Strongylus vulgaris]
MNFLFIALLAIECTAQAAVYQVPLVKIEPKMVQMLRAGTWAAYVKERNAARAMPKALAAQDGYSQDLYDYHDMEYIGNITVGTPAQSFRVGFDTATSDTWIIDYTCSANKPLICDESRCDQGYQMEFLSETGFPLIFVQKHIFQYYRSGANAKGIVGRDTVGLGDSNTNRLEVPGTLIGQANEIDDYFADHPVDGMVGLAFSALSYNKLDSVIEKAAQLQLIEPMFTVYLERAGADAKNVFGGVITYGGLDEQHCFEHVAYTKITIATFWKFMVDRFSFGSYEYQYGTDAISDTTSSFIGFTSSSMLEAVVNHANATVGKFENVTAPVS